MEEKELQKMLGAALEKCGFEAPVFRPEYKIWFGSKDPCVLDLALLVDDRNCKKKTVAGAFEIKCHKGNLTECISQIHRISKGGFPCYVVDCSSGHCRVAEVALHHTDVSNLQWESLNESESKLRKIFRHAVRTKEDAERDVENVEDYLAAVNRIRVSMMHSHKMLLEIKKQCVKFMFRGHPNSDYKLCPGLFRGLEKGDTKEDSYLENIAKKTFWPEEQYLLDEASRMFPDLFRDCKTDIERMAVVQHYEIPTRLLDVSGNALVALYFATQPCAKNGTEKDGEVFVFKVSVGEYRRALQKGKDNLSVDQQHCTKGERAKLPFKHVPRLAFPSFLTQRQKAQDGAFYIFGDDGNRMIGFGNGSYGKIRIPKECKASILEELEQRCNIHKGTLFPESLTSYKEKLICEAAERIRKDEN